MAPKEETLAVLQRELATAEVWDCYIMSTMELLNQYHYISYQHWHNYHHSQYIGKMSTGM